MATGTGTVADPRVYTSAGTINTKMLRSEIAADGYLSGFTTSNIATDSAADTLSVAFTAALDATEQTALDTVVAAHTGTTTTRDVQFWESNGAQSTASDTLVEKLSRTASALKAGTYRLTWYFELKVTRVGPLDSNCMAEFQVDGVTKGSAEHATVGWSAFSGWDRYVATEGETIVLSFDIKRDGGNDTVQIRKMKLGIEKFN